MVCSIIIATCNRAFSLQQTLRNIDELSIPSEWDVELLIANNASTDDTSEVIANCKLKHIQLRSICEAKSGKSRALNAALAQCRGEIILFTDDDVAPAKDWLERIGGPLLKRECDCTVGRVDLTKELRRPWMTRQHLFWLADFQGEPLQLVGANMGLHRSVLDQIPAFDPEIGPGAIGLGEETLFSWQLSEAGLRLKYVPEALVVHFPDPSRLVRSGWLAAARKHGASLAYIMHHWLHEKIPAPRLRRSFLGLKLKLRRLLQPPPPLDSEGISDWEMSYVTAIEQCRQFIIERKRPRSYSKRALRRRL